MRPQDRWLDMYARRFIGTPVMSHLVFGLLALALLTALLVRGRGPDISHGRDAGRGAGSFTAQFFVVSLGLRLSLSGFSGPVGNDSRVLLGGQPRRAGTPVPKLTKFWAIIAGSLFASGNGFERRAFLRQIHARVFPGTECVCSGLWRGHGPVPAFGRETPRPASRPTRTRLPPTGCSKHLTGNSRTLMVRKVCVTHRPSGGGLG